MTDEILPRKILVSELKTDRFSIREIKSQNVEKLKSTLSDGYQSHFAVLIDKDFNVIDGRHRVEACRELGIEEIYCNQEDIPSESRISRAVKANEAAENTAPMNFTDYAELIWSMDGTQQQIAEILGWSRSKVADYMALKSVAQKAWKLVVANISCATENVANATIFSEGILRPILKLTEDQQLDLIEGLISGKYSKQAFKKKADGFQQQNKDMEFARSQLQGIVADGIYQTVIAEIESGRYNLSALIQNALDQHNKETSIKIIHGDCIDELKNIESESIDLVATDPPYNMDKADWDSYGSGEEFAQWCQQWLDECLRILKPEGAIYIFGINRMLSHLQKWLDENMIYRNWIIWDTIQGAGGGLWVNRHEAILYYSKTADTYEDSDAVKLERHEENVREYKGREYRFKNPSNIWRFPCVDDKHAERTDHITQKPVEIMERIIKANCPMGGIVCDPFTGSGTTAVAAYRNNRKFIGFEADKSVYTDAQKRVNREISS